MPILLSEAQKAQIRAAIQDLSDTFFVTDIQYFRYRTSLDPHQEDQEGQYFNLWDLKALVAPMMVRGTYAFQDIHGIVEENEIILIFNLEDLLVLNIVDPVTFEVDMSPAHDFFSINNDSRKFRVIRVTKHGPLDKKDALVKVFGRIEERELPYHVIPPVVIVGPPPPPDP